MQVRSTLPAGKDVLAFQCRNPIHKAHYELFTRALSADNVREGAVCLVHPTCGPTQVRCWVAPPPLAPQRSAPMSGKPRAVAGWNMSRPALHVAVVERPPGSMPDCSLFTELTQCICSGYGGGRSLMAACKPYTLQDDDIPGVVRYRTYEVLKEEVANPQLRWAYLPYSMHMAGPREAIQVRRRSRKFRCTGSSDAGCQCRRGDHGVWY